MNDRFAEYVRQAKFALILTDQMIATINLVHEGKLGAISSPAILGLERRGIVEYAPAKKGLSPWDSDSVRFKLTKAGSMVHGLLEEAGFYNNV